MTRIGTAAAGCLLLSFELAAQQPWTRPSLGQERAVPQHLKDNEELTLPLADLIRFGERLFAANWTEQDGAGRPRTNGSGQAVKDPAVPLIGGRAGNRVSGPDANSCQACHNLPYGITGGGGDFVTVAFDAAERFDFVTFEHGDRPSPPQGGRPSATRGGRASAAPRGSAPNQPSSLQALGLRAAPGLFGAGYLEMVARQMTADLQRIRDGLQPGGSASLTAKGIAFGRLARRANGSWDPSGVEGLPEISRTAVGNRPPSLVLRPWYQSGRAVSLREFTNDALNRNLGIQSVERFGANTDPDGDGVVNEATRGDVTALVAFQATLAVPGRVIPRDSAVERAVAEGETLFASVGCARCHVPSLPLDGDGWIFSEPNPFNPSGTLQRAVKSLQIDLTSLSLPMPRLAPSASDAHAIRVPAYTDFKLHDVSADRSQPPFLTRRLWGAANEPPYWHDGSCTTMRDAIAAHGGEALDVRKAFDALSSPAKDSLIEFLKTLQVLPPGTRSSIVDEHFQPRTWP